MRRKIRTLRHWKQRFDKNAEFIWRKAVKWDKRGHVKPGTLIPKELKEKPGKLRAFWEAGVIELAEFDEPKNVLLGRNEKPAKRYRSLKGGWYEVDTPDGPVKVQSKKRLEELLASLEG